ncbi:hypothetical protein IAD21_06192 [Abditibacteriota bacterium]|nr:hypothetical protein IAD21_06192 [Abditibacteriota bacterium]
MGPLIKIKAVLLAPNDPTPTPSSSEPRFTAREEANFNYALIALCTGLLTFSLVAGLGLVNGSVPVERAYLLMTPLPLALVIWFAVGAFRARVAPDIGLLLSSFGWAFVLFTLLVKHMAVQSAIAAGTPLSQVGDGPLVWILVLLALVSLGAGAFLSWQKARAAGSTP